MTSLDGTYAQRDQRAATPARQAGFDWSGILNTSVAIMMGLSSIVLIEPAPYEFLFAIVLFIFVVGGGRVPVILLPLLVLSITYAAGGFLSLMPHLGNKDAAQFTLVSAYLLVTAVFFACYVSEQTERRLLVIQNGYIFAATIAAVAGFLGYFDIAGLGEHFTLYDRASGTTKDPNVLGTFLVPPLVFILLRFIKGNGTAGPLALFLLLLFSGAILLCFSRGAWANAAGSVGLMLLLLLFATTSNALRWRVLILGTVAVLLLAIGLSIALSFDGMREAFLDRFALQKEYDLGETGRFGNQLRSIPLLLDRPNGLGPLQFGPLFGEDPHNSFINAFSSYGWIGGISYLVLIIATWVIGWRLVFLQTPWQTMSIAVWCPTFFTTLQGVQIDTDHWRHLFLLIGLTWGLFAASVDYQRRHAKMARAPQPLPPTQ
ncbi:MAG: O-antigen ligase domain-containing protein [Rhizobiales bacterium]|nr:O-antigen ligase domain-containing protein [Hyphomicrobiales bacterium]